MHYGHQGLRQKSLTVPQYALARAKMRHERPRLRLSAFSCSQFRCIDEKLDSEGGSWEKY